ncbi:hypothetical protein L9F63_023403, partial [Diploptera punctata]
EMLNFCDKARSCTRRSFRIAASMPLTFCGIAAVNVHHLETLLRSIQSSPYTPRMSLWTTVACAPSLLHSSSFSRKSCNTKAEQNY